MFFEVGDGDFFVGLDGGSEALFCGLVEVVAAEDFFCVGGAEVDEFLVEVGVVGAEFGDVYLVVGFFGPDDAVFSALDVFGADGLDWYCSRNSRRHSSKRWARWRLRRAAS